MSVGVFCDGILGKLLLQLSIANTESQSLE